MVGTAPAYGMMAEEVIAEWRKFRRALRKHDRKIFDMIVERARLHAGVTSCQVGIDPAEMIFLGIFIEQEKELRRLARWKAGYSTSTPTAKED